MYNVIRVCESPVTLSDSQGIDESDLIPRFVNKSMLASKNIIPGVFRAEEGLPWIDLLAGELNVRLTEARDFDPGLWPKTIVLSWRVGFGYGNNLRSRQSGFPFTKALSADYVAKIGRRMWMEAAPRIANPKGVMDVHNVGPPLCTPLTRQLSLQFNDVIRMEAGQSRIEGFLGKRKVEDASDTAKIEHAVETGDAVWTCKECGLQLPTIDLDEAMRQEHQDFHLAEQLQREYRQTTTSTPAKPPALKKAKPDSKGIKAFLKPKR